MNGAQTPAAACLLSTNPELLKRALIAAADENDLVILNAGASAGTRDYSAKVLAEIGEVIVHGVAIKPGKPVILAMIGDTPVIGSAWLSGFGPINDAHLCPGNDLHFPWPGTAGIPSMSRPRSPDLCIRRWALINSFELPLDGSGKT